MAKDKANLGDFDLQAIYVLKISEEEIAGDIMEIEQFQTDGKDVVILARVQ